MSCDLAQTTVHGYFDGELDAVRAAEFERHLESCAACQTALESVTALHTRLQQADLYEPASPRLRQQLSKQFAASTELSRLGFNPWRQWFVIAAYGLLTAAAGFLLAFFLVRPHTTATITAELVDAHVRSLQPGHLTDVLSSDRHTVKPWFDGKLDFIPPVSDYAQQGFPLVGGRLDTLDGHNVAALVYSRRKHLINVFVWPSRDAETAFVNSGSRQGYNWVAWQSAGMQFCLVSDAAPADLHELRELLSGRSP